VLPVLEETLMRLFDASPLLGQPRRGSFRRLNWASRETIVPAGGREVLVIDAEKSPEATTAMPYICPRLPGWLAAFIIYDCASAL